MNMLLLPQWFPSLNHKTATSAIDITFVTLENVEEEVEETFQCCFAIVYASNIIFHDFKLGSSAKL